MSDQAVAYRIMQNGVPVARAEGQHSLREIMLATRAYAQDGPLSIQKRIKRHWRGFGIMGRQLLQNEPGTS